MHGYRIFSFAVSVIFIALIAFAVLQWLDIPVGSFVDWLFGIGVFAWLATLVTVPWNIMFEALEVLNESKDSDNKNIRFDRNKLPYVRRLYKVSLISALGLHLASAAGLYWLASAGISAVGYYGAGAAFLLMFFRPAVRAYDYISRQLSAIRQEILYPREDMYQLKSTLEETRAHVDRLADMLDGKKKDSWLFNTELRLDALKNQAEESAKLIRQLETKNREEHELMAKETRQAVAQLTEDGKFIDNLVEIIRFIKKV